jgi:hypothetical protein
MCGICLRPCGHAAVLEAVAAADDGLEVWDVFALLLSGLLLLGERSEGIRNKDSSGRTEPVVVKDQVAEGYVLGEEVYQGCLGVQPESIVGEVDGVELRKREERGKKV